MNLSQIDPELDRWLKNVLDHSDKPVPYSSRYPSNDIDNLRSPAVNAVLRISNSLQESFQASYQRTSVVPIVEIPDMVLRDCEEEASNTKRHEIKMQNSKNFALEQLKQQHKSAVKISTEIVSNLEVKNWNDRLRDLPHPWFYYFQVTVNAYRGKYPVNVRNYVKHESLHLPELTDALKTLFYWIYFLLFSKLSSHSTSTNGGLDISLTIRDLCQHPSSPSNQNSSGSSPKESKKNEKSLESVIIEGEDRVWRCCRALVSVFSENATNTILCSNHSHQLSKAGGVSECVDLLLICLTESIVQCYRMTFLKSASLLHDGFAVCVYAIISKLTSNFSLSPLSIYVLRSKSFASLLHESSFAVATSRTVSNIPETLSYADASNKHPFPSQPPSSQELSHLPSPRRLELLLEKVTHQPALLASKPVSHVGGEHTDGLGLTHRLQMESADVGIMSHSGAIDTNLSVNYKSKKDQLRHSEVRMSSTLDVCDALSELLSQNDNMSESASAQRGKCSPIKAKSLSSTNAKRCAPSIPLHERGGTALVFDPFFVSGDLGFSTTESSTNRALLIHGLETLRRGVEETNKHEKGDGDNAAEDFSSFEQEDTQEGLVASKQDDQNKQSRLVNLVKRDIRRYLSKGQVNQQPHGDEDFEEDEDDPWTPNENQIVEYLTHMEQNLPSAATNWISSVVSARKLIAKMKRETVMKRVGRFHSKDDEQFIAHVSRFKEMQGVTIALKESSITKGREVEWTELRKLKEEEEAVMRLQEEQEELKIALSGTLNPMSTRYLSMKKSRRKGKLSTALGIGVGKSFGDVTAFSSPKENVVIEPSKNGKSLSISASIANTPSAARPQESIEGPSESLVQDTAAAIQNEVSREEGHTVLNMPSDQSRPFQSFKGRKMKTQLQISIPEGEKNGFFSHPSSRDSASITSHLDKINSMEFSQTSLIQLHDNQDLPALIVGTLESEALKQVSSPSKKKHNSKNHKFATSKTSSFSSFLCSPSHIAVKDLNPPQILPPSFPVSFSDPSITVSSKDHTASFTLSQPPVPAGVPQSSLIPLHPHLKEHSSLKSNVHNNNKILSNLNTQPESEALEVLSHYVASCNQELIKKFDAPPPPDAILTPRPILPRSASIVGIPLSESDDIGSRNSASSFDRLPQNPAPQLKESKNSIPDKRKKKKALQPLKFEFFPPDLMQTEKRISTSMPSADDLHKVPWKDSSQTKFQQSRSVPVLHKIPPLQLPVSLPSLTGSGDLDKKDRKVDNLKKKSAIKVPQSQSTSTQIRRKKESDADASSSLVASLLEKGGEMFLCPYESILTTSLSPLASASIPPPVDEGYDPVGTVGNSNSYAHSSCLSPRGRSDMFSQFLPQGPGRELRVVKRARQLNRLERIKQSDKKAKMSHEILTSQTLRNEQQEKLQAQHTSTDNETLKQAVRHLSMISKISEPRVLVDPMIEVENFIAQTQRSVQQSLGSWAD
eukprot:GDKJ01022015.1.p1 GENE.GDKJ01022015.1~~GDKJ01022015.1.p1  ORF type:complete len:1482 (+),score=326.40 GDKJ01022015.1:56-4447(+)